MVRNLIAVYSSIFLSVALLFMFLDEIRSERSNLTYSYLSWSNSPRLPTALGNHQLLLWGNNVYVIGGSPNDENPLRDDPTDTVSRSSIQPDGKLGNWVPITSVNLPAIMISAGDVSRDGWMYVTGGHNGSSFLTTTYYGKELQPNVIEWHPSAYSFAAARGLHTTVIVKEGVKDEIYAIGGLGYSDPAQTVVYSTLNPDTGELDGPWVPTTSLLPQRFGHATVTYKGWIYAIGGTTIDPQGQHITKSVRYAKADNGIQGTWDENKSLPAELSDLEAVVTNDGRIFVMGGRNTSSLTRTVYVATIINTQTGELSAWQPVPELDLPLETGLHSFAAVFAPNGSIYVVGGQDNNLKYHANNHYVDSVFHIPLLTFTKSADPPGSVHEGGIITYTLSYANTSLIPQTITISDPLPFGLTLVPNSATPTPDVAETHNVVWNLRDVSPGTSGQVSFQARVALLPSLHQQEVGIACTPEPPTPTPSPDYILPVPVACDTTQFWANGVTRQPPEPIPHTILVQVPPGADVTAMWLLMKGTNHAPPEVDGVPAHELSTTAPNSGATIWTAVITPTVTTGSVVTITTENPRELNAVYLFDKNDPPFDESALSGFQNERKPLTYTLEIPTVETQTLDVILPFMDVTYWTDDLQPNPYLTTVTVQFDDQPAQTVVANMPNMGNGLLMTRFPFAIGPLGTDIDTATEVLTVTVDTQDDIYTLGPRVCRPVRIENTAWLCSQQAGCISSTVTNAPRRPMTGGFYLPIILKPSP
jgi:uncharacterized repeat protein (TIGR01451 family)